jgi:hypothetical protein
MAGQDADKNMSVGERQEIFLALVEDQDKGADVARSRRSIASRFGLTEQQVRQIEREGLDASWPPLA